MNKYLEHYLVAVKHTDVSGFEHLEMLAVRDKLANEEQTLTAEETAQLEAADRQLLAQASQFYAALVQITDLHSERQYRQPPPDRWWWYLDVLTRLPQRPLYSQYAAA